MSNEGVRVDPLSEYDPLVCETGIEDRYLGTVDEEQGRVVITDETNPANAWISSTVSYTLDEVQSLGGGE